MAEAGLQEPLFKDFRGEFSVTLYNERNLSSRNDSAHKNEDILEFCAEPRNRKELVDFLGLASAQYALKRYVDPLVKSGQLTLSIPEKPKSPKQTYIATHSKK